MKDGVRSLLGAIGFLRKFILGSSGILKPLTDLTEKNKSEKVVWQTEHQEAFEKVKQILTGEQILKWYQKKRSMYFRLMHVRQWWRVIASHVCQPKATSQRIQICN